ncbi:hypothetical protein [Bradyrhizobium vignae]|uniref:hypothetical protein n=1 Tax=Bradyrhizobium vignae TaxID=1549949 RepID=UPI00100B14D7|nr:hypothetical protein [Bradyrhizobium vignae]RXG92279.1 hypothetical protein EAV90_27225 [Bradyrhizobium vignae]
MTAKAMRVEDAPVRAAKPISRLLDYGKATVNYRKQLKEVKTFLEDRWTIPIPATEAAIRDVAVLLDLMAVYTAGAAMIDDYLAWETDFDHPTRERLKASAIANAPRGYTPQQIGQMLGVLWATHRRLDLRQIDAIDRPPRDVLDEIDRQRAVEYSRNYRASKPKKPSQAQLDKDALIRRRIATVKDVIPPQGSSISNIAAKLLAKKIERGPFADVKKENLPRVLRELVKDNSGAFRTEFRPPAGRPDDRPQQWIFSN